MQEIKLEDILKNTEDLSEKKVGYVAIIGRPNVGKSTFINTLLGEKVSLTTNVPQTTRKKVLAIHNDDESQIIFFDTPGIHKSNIKFNEEINNEAIDSLDEADLVLYFIDSTRAGGEEERYIKTLIGQIKSPVVKVYTKIDLAPQINIPAKAIAISSETKDGFEGLLTEIKSRLKTGPMLFPSDIYTKQDMYFRISEIIREKVFLNTREEIPHSIYVGVDEIDDGEELLKIVAYIYTESESQKYIVIGNSGKLIGKIGKESRLELEKVFDKKVFLALRAKTSKGWRKNEGLVKSILK